jgi:hypothetical protein
VPDGDLAGDSLSIADAQHGGALELVDLAGTQDGPEAVIAGNIFHRAVAFGPCQPGLPADGLDVRVLMGRCARRGEPLTT